MSNSHLTTSNSPVLSVEIGPISIGSGSPCFVIAEAGVNHNGDLERALKLIDAAADAGADAVKFQTLCASKLVSPSAPKAQYQMQTTNPEESQFEMIRSLELKVQDYPSLLAHARNRGIMFLSSPFDESGTDLLHSFDVPAFKIPSGEIVNLPYLRHAAAKGRPLIVSTGMSNLSEVERAVREIESTGNRKIVLLHCVSSYPAVPAAINLRAMETLQRAFGYPVGFSDHTDGFAITLAAVAREAATIEKHLTLDKTLPGPDHKASLEPSEFRLMVRAIRDIEAALGSGIKVPHVSEVDCAMVARKSVAASRDLPAGSVIQASDTIMLRPGTGLEPASLRYVLGRTVRTAIKEGEQITLENLR